MIGALILLLITIVLNYICVEINITSGLYRLTCFRYLFLAVPAYMLLDIKRYNRVLVYALAVGSLVYIAVLYKHDMAPLTLDYGWSVQQWPAYFWTLLVFLILSSLAKRLDNSQKLYITICWLGKNSWYIFLAQMFILSYISIGSFSFIGNDYLRVVLFILLVLSFSIGSALVINFIRSNK